MITGLQVNVSSAVEPVLDMLTVIFSGGWRSKQLFEHVHSC